MTGKRSSASVASTTTVPTTTTTTAPVSSIWTSTEMPILDESFLAQYGALTVEQFFRKQQEEQILALKSQCTTLIDNLQSKSKFAQLALLEKLIQAQNNTNKAV